VLYVLLPLFLSSFGFLVVAEFSFSLLLLLLLFLLLLALLR
jgi:hypothetical protein